MLFHNYQQRVERWRQSNSCIMWLPLTDMSGSTANDLSPENNDGTYRANARLGQGVGADGQPCINFSGTGGGDNESVELYSSGFNSDLDGDEVTYMIWAKADAGVYTDATTRFLFLLQNGDGDFATILKPGSNNTIRFEVQIDGAGVTHNHSTSSTAWHHYAISISKTNNKVRYFKDGIQLSAPTFPGTSWDGNIDSQRSQIAGNFESGFNMWKGDAQHFMVLDKYMLAGNFTPAITPM